MVEMPRFAEPPDLSGRIMDRARRAIIHENRVLAARVRELENELGEGRAECARLREKLATREAFWPSER